LSPASQDAYPRTITPVAPVRLDDTDRAILRELADDASLTNRALAGRVHLSPSSCLARVRRLQQGGVIRGVHADISPAAIGRGLEALIAVRLRLHTTDAVAALSAHLHTIPEVVSFYHLTGAEDFLVHVAVADTDELRSLVLSAFTSRPEIARTNTSLVFHHERISGVTPLG
jgi:DNA-binding Lrp family transcriptional regulator